MTDKVQKIHEEVERLQNLTMDKNKNFYSEVAEGEYNALCNIEHFIDSLEESVREDYEIYGSVAAVNALERKRVCPQLKGDALHKFKNEFNTIKQIVHLLYDYEDPFCYRVALHWASWGAYNLKSFGNINEKEKAKMDIPEKSVSIWHDASEIPDNSEDIVIEHSEYGINIIPACKMSRVKGAKWARLDDILKL